MNNEVRLEDVCLPVFGITSRRYRQMATDGKTPAVRDGKIDFAAAAKALIQFYRDLADGQGSVSLIDERARLTRINADRKELELKKYRGDLIETEKAMMLWGRVIESFKLRILSWKPRMPALFVGVQDAKEGEAIAEKLTNEVLNELSNPDLAIGGGAGHKSNNRHAATTAKADDKQMGRRKSGAQSRKQRGARAVVHRKG